MGTRQYRLSELADLVGGAVNGDGSIPIRGVAGIREAGTGDITFLANSNYARFLETTNASAVIKPSGIAARIPAIELENPYLAFLKIVSMFTITPLERYPRGVHPSAVVDASATYGANVGVGPYCHIGARSVIGDNVTVLGGVHIGEDVIIGDDCLIYPRVTIRDATRIGDRVILHPGVVLGSDGFGFAHEKGVRVKVPHIGCVVLEGDVEIGANTTVDRATTGETLIGRGTKIDNLVQIAHNVTIGEHCAIAAQVGISGSTKIGSHVVIAGQVGIAGHIEIGDGVVVGAQAGVTKSIPPQTTVSGYPAREHSKQKRLHALTQRLPSLQDRVRAIEEKLKHLETRVVDGQATKDG